MALRIHNPFHEHTHKEPGRVGRDKEIVGRENALSEENFLNFFMGIVLFDDSTFLLCIFYETERSKRKPLNKSVKSKMWTNFLAVSLKKP